MCCRFFGCDTKIVLVLGFFKWLMDPPPNVVVFRLKFVKRCKEMSFYKEQRFLMSAASAGQSHNVVYMCVNFDV